MRGKDINLTVLAGVEAERAVRFVREDGSLWPLENVAVSGEIWDMEMAEVLGEIECKVTEDGRIELTYPAMGLGRYVFVVDGQGDDGEKERLMEGYIGYEEPRMLEAGEYVEEMVVMVRGDVRKVLFGRNTAWEGLYEETIKAKDEAEKAAEGAEGAKNEVLEALKGAQDFIDSFHEAVRDVIYIGSNGNWWIGGEDTGRPSQGKNGLTPHIGADGYWYVGETCLERKACGEDGLTPYIGTNGNWCIGAIDTGVPARGRDGIDGWKVRRILVDSYGDIPWSGETCNGGFYYYVPNEDEYDVYAWLEPDGWVKVGLANDIATQEIYGLVKLGTDNVADVGAPVAVNEDGEMTIPQASTAVYGSAKISAADTMGVNTDGAIGLTEDGKLRAEHATARRFGTVKPSRPDDLAMICSIGIIPQNTIVDDKDRAGLLGSTPPLDDTYGPVKIAYKFTGFNGLDYLVPIGLRMDATEGSEATNSNYYWGANGQAGVPLEVGGALRWISTGSMTRDGKTYSTGGRMKLLFSNQFSSSQGYGLTLETATTTKLSGVYIATSLGDTRVNAVPNAATVLAGDNGVVTWANDTFRRLDDCYSSSQVDALFDAFAQTVYLKTEVDNMLNDLRDEMYDKEEADARYVRVGRGDGRIIHTMYKSEFDQLTTRDANAIYFVKRDV